LTDPFKRLGLKRATATQADVKAAYARLLKVTRPEDDRDAFMALRAAFEEARRVATFRDAQQPDDPPVQDADDPALNPASNTASAPVSTPPAIPPRWTFDESLQWHFLDGPHGKLVEDTVRWMVAGGPDAAGFTADVSEQLIANPDINGDAYRTEVVQFIFTASDPAGKSHEQDLWTPFEGVRPGWLGDALIHALHDDLGLLRFQPPDTIVARNYNTVRQLFAPALSGDTALADPVDVIEIFEREETGYRKDAHGSYFDRSAKQWVDMSPVSVAMRDLEASFKNDLWDMEQKCRAILNRDEVQSLDEFQDLDARLRQFICTSTGINQGKSPPLKPAWMTKQMVLLFDDTFGWSRHYGSQPWQRQQYAWLHRIIGRYRDISGQMGGFQAIAAPTAAPQTADTLTLYGWLFQNPLRILAAYILYRIVQILWRLAV
jgi:hypothetical protein